MKTGILIIALLVVSVFAIAFTMAVPDKALENGFKAKATGKITDKARERMEIAKQKSNEKAIGVSEILSADLENGNVTDALNETGLGLKNKYGKLGFATVLKGTGWITSKNGNESNNEGYLIAGLWVSQRFAKINNETGNVTDTGIVRQIGRLNIAGIGLYKLVKIGSSNNSTTSENETANSISFYVIPVKAKILDLDETESKSVGTLSLEKKAETSSGLIIWEGTLIIDDENIDGSFDVDLATIKSTVNPGKANQISNLKNSGKIPFWKKFFSWQNNKDNKGNNENNSENNETDED